MNTAFTNVIIDQAARDRFITYLKSKQLAEGTIKRYIFHLSLLALYAGDLIMDFLNVGWHLAGEKVQRQAFIPPNRFLTKEEYFLLLNKAVEMKDLRLAMVLQTLCGTGIRVSELKFITVECLSQGCVQVKNKGKARPIILPCDLVKELEKYCRKRGITTGSIFVTRTGKPLDRSNIWKMLKRLAERAGVAASKVFPHNLRHLFARTFEEKHHDTPSLATVLGHSSINTTRIYIAGDGQKERQMMDGLGLILTVLPQS